MLRIQRLCPDDGALARALNAMFSAVFEAPEQYGSNPPSDAWLAARLAGPNMICLVARDGDAVRKVGRPHGY